MTQVEKLLEIINHYGVMPQLKYFQSEVFELGEAIIEKEYHNFYFDVDNEDITIAERDMLTKHIAEEIADVLNMVEQFMYYYDIKIEDVIEIKHQKIDRQINRIKEEK